MGNCPVDFANWAKAAIRVVNLQQTKSQTRDFAYFRLLNVLISYTSVESVPYSFSLYFNLQMADLMTFNARKAAQIVAFFIMKSGGNSIDVLKAVKLVYLGDRQSIEDFGFPITDDSHVSMPQGPVNSITYSHINGEYDLDACGWSEFLEGRANYQIGAKGKFDIGNFDELSDADIQALDKVWGKFGHMNKWQLRDWTHNRKNVPEWEDPHGSSQPIPLARILTLLQIENADEHADLIEDHKHLDRMFASLRE